MMDTSDTTDEYSSVKVIVTKGDIEIVYDIPIITDFELDTIFDEPEIRPLEKRFPDLPDVKSITFTMHPIPVIDNHGVSKYYMTITRTARAVVVAVDEAEAEAFHQSYLIAKSEWDNE